VAAKGITHGGQTGRQGIGNDMSQGSHNPGPQTPGANQASAAARSATEIDSTVVWQQLSEHMDALASAWQSAMEPPRLADFLPADPPAIRRLTLIEAVKIDMEYRWQGRRWPKRIEQYQAEFPELAGAAGIPCDVIYEEYHIRRQQGDDVSAEEFFTRFPARADELRRLFDIATPDHTTVLVPADRVPTFEVGQQVDDFDLLNLLGKGAFASVFLARQRSMQRLVALKISRDRGFEPQTLAQLEHSHIVRVFDQRQLSKLRLLYMQYVPGGTLQGVIAHARQLIPAARGGGALLEAIDQALRKKGEEPPADSMTRHKLQRASWHEVVCWLGARLAGALAYAHGRGVLHRDIKPANVLIGADGHPKLADFNISFSKLDGATPAAYFGGTVAYMSPEQLEASDPAHHRQPEELDGRTDVYSLGVVLWELLTGRRPFVDDKLPDNWSQGLAKITQTRRAGVSAQTVAAVPPDVPPMVVDVLLKCLQPMPRDRFASAAELARELDLCLQPRAHALLHGGRNWAALCKRYPVAATIACGLIPNIICCVLNIVYNWAEIVGRLSIEDQRVFFQFQIIGVNSVAYTVGLGYIVATRGKLFAALGRLARGETVTGDGPVLVRRLVTFPTAAAAITALLWTISGFVIPVWLHYGAGDASKLSAEHYRHFIVSNLLCGMIAATQTFYVVALFAVRYCYPWLIRGRLTGVDSVSELAALAQRSRTFLALTVSVPFFALSALVLINFDRIVIGLLGAIGLIGCGLAYWLDQAVRGDLSALVGAVHPSADPLLADETLDSFTTGSHRSGRR